MKTTRTLRLLSLLGFLVLLAPFYDSCDGDYIHKVNEDGTEIKIEKPFKEKAYDIIVDDLSFNGFEMASIFPLGLQDFKSFDEFETEVTKSFQKEDWYNNIGMLVSLLFDFIVVLSFLLVILSFFKKQKLFTKLALTNSILVSITFCYIVFLEHTFEHWHQIKWGYYAFIITNLLIFYYSKKRNSQLQ